jgi:hypothetical protein
MRTLLLCVFFLGCKSPATYEIIEVKNGETMQHLHRWNRGVRGRPMPEVPRPNGARGRSDFNPFEAREENTAKGRAVLGPGLALPRDRR